MDKLEKQLIKIIKKQEWLMELLREVRKLKLPDWYIAAGTIRNTVWDYLHNKERTPLNDIDIVFFDDSDQEREENAKKILAKKFPGQEFELINQAKTHLFEANKNRPKIHSSCEAISFFSETATCVGVRLEDDDSFTVCAVHGLDDLMNLIVQHSPTYHQSMEIYFNRVKEKKWKQIWPKLKILHHQ